MTEIVVSALLLRAIAAAPSAGPTVKLGAATVQGVTQGDINSYLGIPFAEPPCVRQAVLGTEYTNVTESASGTVASICQ